MPLKTIVITISAFFIFAVSALAASYDWPSKGITVATDAEIEGEEQHQSSLEKADRLTDEQGRSFTLIYKNTLSDITADRIIQIKNRLYDLKYITVKSLTFRVSDNDIIDIILVPSAFSFIETNPQEFAPAGVLLQYTDILEYKFNIVKDGIVVRIAGVLSDEERFKNILTEAYANPREYMRKREPEYILRELDNATANISKLQEKQQEYETRLYGLTVLQNKGFFGGMNVINKDTVTKVVEMKKATPSMTRDQVKENLKNTGTQLTDKELKIIFAVYFNEFE